jgi:F-type H+-transporting ATPase subunit gamma
MVDPLATIVAKLAMSQRREVEARLALFDELTGILGAMRSFALAELRRVNKREAAQQQVVESLTCALNDLPATAISDAQERQTSACGPETVWLLFGSVRGFCGSFNEEVLRFWQDHDGAQTASVIVVGQRLYELIDRQHPSLFPIAGAQGSLDAAAVIDRILAVVDQLGIAERPDCRLMACLRDEQGPLTLQLWPLASSQPQTSQYPPNTFSPIEEVASGIAQQYLFHKLLALLLRAIQMENHLRLLQMETALRHLEHGGEDLLRQRNRLRQEEIVEEIELMASSRRG